MTDFMLRGSDDRDAALLRDRAAALAVPLRREDRSDLRPVVTFRIGTERFGTDARCVREVRPVSTIARLPHAPDILLGVTRVRSGVIPVFSLLRLVGVQGEQSVTARWIVVLDDGQRAPLGVVADEVEGVEMLAAGEVEATTGTIDARGIALGVLPDGRRLLDATSLLSIPPAYEELESPRAGRTARANDDDSSSQPADRETA